MLFDDEGEPGQLVGIRGILVENRSIGVQLAQPRRLLLVLFGDCSQPSGVLICDPLISPVLGAFKRILGVFDHEIRHLLEH